MISKKNETFAKFFWATGFSLLFFAVLQPTFLYGQDFDTVSDQEDTMLMFVGENLEVLSIASKREESAWQAPAVAQVVTRKHLMERGARTLEEALSMTPGFYMAQKEWGTMPYLRGIPNSVLFLYDTVPLGSDTTKSLHQLDRELSLAPVKRIEIVRGPGSVLWGPDAFAGIVNVVPMSGKDLEGAETALSYEGPGDQKSFYVNAGHDAGRWDGFVSISGRTGGETSTEANLVRFWNDLETPYPPEDRFGSQYSGDSHYFELSGRLSIEDWLALSGRISENKRPYAMTDDTGELTWIEEQKLPFCFLKFESKIDTGRYSALRFTGYHSEFDPEYAIIDRKVRQDETTDYIEGIYNQSFFAGRGLLTGGASLREKRVKNAPVWEDYLPDLLGTDNEDFLPRLKQEDYDTTLWSFYGQYSQKISDFDLLMGLRYDAHDQYRDHFSFSTGAGWVPHSAWIFKLLYGSAYRTPFSRQLIEEEEPDLERIKSLSLQIAWKPSDMASLSVVGFSSRISNHIMEDPYAGLSLPNKQDIQGVEMEGRLIPFKGLEFSANFTFIDNDGPDEKYYFNDFTFVRPDGTVEKHFTTLIYPYDTGADRLLNLMCTWKPHERLTLFLRANYYSSRDLIYPRGEETVSFPGVWLADASATIKDIFAPGMDLDISIKNIADTYYKNPGTYHAIDGDPFEIEILLRKKW